MSVANLARSAANLFQHPLRLLVVLTRAALVVSMVAVLSLAATAANMRASHASDAVVKPASALHVATKQSCPDHDKKTSQHCPQSCCVAICGFYPLATLSALNSAGKRDLIAIVRFATSDARRAGIEVGFDPPPPRDFD